MRKYTSADGTAQVVSPEAHKAIEENLHRFEKSSARVLSDSQRESLEIAIDKSDSTR